ncbi:LCP family protein [Paenibacillus marinisediminis]
MKTKKKSAKKWWIILAVVLIIALSCFVFRKQLAILAFDLFLSDTVEHKLDPSYQPIAEKPVVDRELEEPFSAALLGIDQRDNEIGRSDTIIYSVVRPKDNKVLLVSIPRDTYTEIVGHGTTDKINHAYAFGTAKGGPTGGAKMSMDTISNLLDSPVDHYATINFEGLKEVVDALGGIRLPITEDIVNKDPNHEKFTIEGGKELYNGQEALYYVRYREDSDMNRTERHRIFIQAVMDRAIELDQIGKFPQILEVVGNNFTTDMKPKNMINLAKYMFKQDTSPAISSYMLHGEGEMDDGVWYYMPDEEDLTYVKELINNWLDPKTTKDQLMVPRQMSND